MCSIHLKLYVRKKNVKRNQAKMFLCEDFFCQISSRVESPFNSWRLTFNKISK